MTIKTEVRTHVRQKSDEHLEGHRGIPIVISKPGHKFDLDEAALEELLLQENVKDRQVVIISVAGAFRKGKSFLLDFFLRYMRAKYVDSNISYDNDEWMGPLDMPLKGFPWRGGSERETSGILMWSEIFLTTLSNNEEIAIIFLDTQGTFDSESTVKDCATIFALSTMISSVQIYNLSQNIQEDDLQHLQLFTEYGRLALANSGEKPFQKLQFLVRDWSFPYEAEYGEVGGSLILSRRLKISEKQHPELQSIRKHIYSCFSEISCFLMPHPGLKVATNPNFDGRLSDIEFEFKECLKKLVPLLLEPKSLILKKINGNTVRAKDLLLYFKSYIKVYSGDELPEPKTLLAATAEANNLSAMVAAKDMYQSIMESVCGGSKPYINPTLLEKEHLRIKSDALQQFINKRKMGGKEFSETYKNKLESDMEEIYAQFKQHNETKNIFKAVKTPIVFFVLALVSHFLSGAFAFVGLYSFANMANWMMAICFITLTTWCWLRYNGDMIQLLERIDEVAAFIWEYSMKVFHEGSLAAVEQPAQDTTLTTLLATSVENSEIKYKQS